MTYPEALQYLDSFTNYEKHSGYDYNKSFRLERMAHLASLLGNPQDAIKSIHVAGTKGKGSTCAFIHSILKEAGFRAGLYTSPHLVSFRERIRIDDELISEADISRILETVKKAVDSMGEERPTFFEVYTAVAYLYFKEKRPDFVVYETGLGGRLDATNILKPLVTAITPISYEHTDKLGKTLLAIAAEKGGIIKENTPCVIAPQEDEARETILKICRSKNAKAVMIGNDVRYRELSFDDASEKFSVSTPSADYGELKTGLLGNHQVANAAMAIGIIEVLRSAGIAIDNEAVSRGLRNVKWPGRLEVVAKKPAIILDGAQNRASAKALASAVERAFKYKKLMLVLGVSSDKDITGILDELLPIADEVVLTKADVPDRASDPVKLRAMIEPRGRKAYLTNSLDEALAKARSLASKDDVILVTGSLFVVGDARKILV